MSVNYVYLPTDQDNIKMVKNVLVEISMNLPFSIPYAKDILNKHITSNEASHGLVLSCVFLFF